MTHFKALELYFKSTNLVIWKKIPTCMKQVNMISHCILLKRTKTTDVLGFLVYCVMIFYSFGDTSY